MSKETTFIHGGRNHHITITPLMAMQIGALTTIYGAALSPVIAAGSPGALNAAKPVTSLGKMQSQEQLLNRRKQRQKEWIL